MKRAFTLIEINLAMLIMAGGILSLVGLYSLGFRENSHSIEDVDGAAFAQLVIGEITKALSQTDVEWSKFNSIQTQNWEKYLDDVNGLWVCRRDPSSTANGVFQSTVSVGGKYTPSVGDLSKPTDLKWALAVIHESNSAVVTIAVRAGKDLTTFVYQPVYIATVRFQGVQTQANTEGDES